MQKVGMLCLAGMVLAGCLSEEKSFGQSAGYGRSYHSPVMVQIPGNAPSITQQFRRVEGNEHYGLDVHAAIGTPVIAAAGGDVVASFFGPMYGHQIEILHQPDATGVASRTRYVHLQKRLVEKGDTVSRGEQVGTMGASGVLAGGFPHLHFEALYRGDSILHHARDPNLFWVNGLGKVTCYEPKHDALGSETFLLTYPVQCK